MAGGAVSAVMGSGARECWNCADACTKPVVTDGVHNPRRRSGSMSYWLCRPAALEYRRSWPDQSLPALNSRHSHFEQDRILQLTAPFGEHFSVGVHAIRNAALDAAPVAGLTHQHYKYPARFSPSVARSVIDVFSRPGDGGLDPYMGGGTTIVEALASGRRAVGCDINSLAVFVTKAKTTHLTSQEAHEVEVWALNAALIGYHDDASHAEPIDCSGRTRNLHLPRSRAIKKFLSIALASIDALESDSTRVFVRCVLLSVSQWALNGSKTSPTLDAFRKKLIERTMDMLRATESLFGAHDASTRFAERPHLIHASANHLLTAQPFAAGTKADLVVTSPPYPGLHVLYHRWQVDGRKETPAPYWIANCLDGQGSSYYNFGSRHQKSNDDYFEASLTTLLAVRSVMRTGGTMVQMIAFSDAHRQLPRYLANMETAGFREPSIVNAHSDRIWRAVPGRSWHANLRGKTGGSREVVLIHTAV